MGLAPKTKLGPYELIGPLGAGGMGEVYHARDTRLERTVAIKVLPAHLSSDVGLRQRFEREARAISSLNHPHICTLFDVGHQDGTDFLVMEYLEGETLAERLDKGPLPLEQVFKIAREIADALDKAHRQGLVHRDLKPGNVMLTKAGAKLMDFGLAKPTPGPLGSASVPITPTTPTISMGALALTAAAQPLTRHGTIVGTFQYMSPEVLQGAEADARSDIFSLGCLLYEMATGKPAFEGKSQLSVLAAILEREPEPISKIQPLAPAALDYVIRTCLAKDPEERFQTAHDVKLQLKWLGEAKTTELAAPLRRRTSISKRTVATAAAAGWAVALAALALWLAAGRTAPAPKVSAELNAPTGGQYVPSSQGTTLTLSPDGSKLAFLVGGARGDNALWVRDLSSGKAQEVPGTASAIYPFWSADSKQLGFFSEGKLKKVALDGGPVQVLCDAPEGRGASWSSKGFIVFTPRIEDALYLVSQGGGTPQKLTTIPRPGWTHRNPYFLPDGEHFLFISRDAENAAVGSLYAGSLKGDEPKLVLHSASNVQYSNGYLLYLREGNLVAQPFDAGALKVTGEPIPVAEKLDYWNPKDVAAFAAANGVLVYRQANVRSSQPVVVDPSGKEVARIGEDGMYDDISASPDGSKLGLVRHQDTAHSDVWVVDLKRNTISRSTFAEAPAISFAFSPDGSRIAVSAIAGSQTHEGWIQSVSGSGGQEKLTLPTQWTGITDWSRDGRYLFAWVQNNATREDIYYIDLQGDRKPKPFVQTPRSETDPMLSPNGKWLAYTSDESGRREIYVTSFPNPGGKWQISSGGGTKASWSADGKQLYYRSGDKLMSVAVQNVDTFQFSSPVELPISMSGVGGYAPGATPGQFVLLKHTGQSQGSPLQMVVNWSQGLKN